jgi:DnaA-homolog protein
MKQLIFDIAPPPAPTLDNFVTGPNAEVVAALRGLLEGSLPERFLYLWGGVGSGKSHLLQAFAAASAAQRRRACLVREPGLQPDDTLAACDVVLVDDALALNAEGQQRLFNLINRMRDGSGSLIVTGPYAPTHLNIRPDLSSRLGQCLVFQVKCLSDADKEQALIAHAQTRGFTLARDVAAYLLRKWQRDLPSLMAVLDELDRYSLEVKRPITLPLVREVLQALLND